jgi:hypothetical protein
MLAALIISPPAARVLVHKATTAVTLREVRLITEVVGVAAQGLQLLVEMDQQRQVETAGMELL